ncbi:hypothetical protein F0562_004488 [Nyssa sinensis]|uniref:Uncharacterized protein n=1 Tax=Nyssa sinensis TaxID=561372 RepID=A0A5J5C3S7_9ASTE|nr:hypothetical protein F0562_004488 [Nyssa sinensis]
MLGNVYAAGVQKVFIAISLILGDGLYNLIKIIAVNVKEMSNNSTQPKNLPIFEEVSDSLSSKLLMEQRKRDEVFLKDKIPSWIAASGYVGLAAISTAAIPIIFAPLKWYLVLCSYILAPALAFAFCNSYGTGLTDWTLASISRKIGLFIIASLVGRNGGVIAGLAACGVMMAIVSTAADLMQDFKTGYLTLIISQVYASPYAVIFREMAILGTEGFSELPKHCLARCCGFFVAALVINLLRDLIPPKISQFIPIPMAMAVPFYIGAYFAIYMFVGTVIFIKGSSFGANQTICVSHLSQAQPLTTRRRNYCYSSNDGLCFVSGNRQDFGLNCIAKTYAGFQQ